MSNCLSSIDTVIQQILDHVKPLPPLIGPALSNQLGIVIAEDILADSDMPALPTSRMDGYAIRKSDLILGKVLSIVGSTLAGNPAGHLVGASACFKIATGALLPSGSDCVIPEEEVRKFADKIEILSTASAQNKYIRNAGEEFRKGQILIKSGTPLGPVEYGLLALAGRTSIQQLEMPKISLISSGDEIIEPGIKPESHQTRNSNGPMLMAQLCRAGALPRFLGIAPDKPAPLLSLLKEGSNHEAMVLSGGASKGECDLVRNALIQLGYDIFIHGVMMKPGKPFFCARDANGKLAFGLPGNPVSAFVCMELFVRPAIQLMRGVPHYFQSSKKKGLIQSRFEWMGDRPLVLPMKKNLAGNLDPCSISGSADLLAISGVNSLALLNASGKLMAGDQVEFICVE